MQMTDELCARETLTMNVEEFIALLMNDRCRVSFRTGM